MMKVLKFCCRITSLQGIQGKGGSRCFRRGLASSMYHEATVENDTVSEIVLKNAEAHDYHYIQ
jgi:hypothetical protein